MQLLIAQKGEARIVEAPDPVPAEHEVLLQTAWSAVSPGTELQAIEDLGLSPAALIRRAGRSLDKVRKSLARRGWRQTLAKVHEVVGKPVPLGYSASGRVLKVGSAVTDFQPDDWVVAVGPGAGHGTLACAPRLLCAKIPKPELARDASAAALACIGIHAIHRAELTSGAEVAVMGLGVIGQLTVQALRASGHRVAAFDPVESRRSDAASSGAEVFDPSRFPFEEGRRFSSHGEGFDAVFLCAKADSADLVRQAVQMCRKRARLIVVGQFPIQLPRDEAYDREIELRVSAAYGEGRYDPSYEILDQDYPIAQARWTVRRNLDLFLRWLEEGRIDPSRLQPAVEDFEQAPRLYTGLAHPRSTLNFLGYRGGGTPRLFLEQPPRSEAGPSAVPLAVIGAGRFAVETHLPNLARMSDKFQLHTLAGRSPSKIAALAQRFGAARATCDMAAALADPAIRAALIATPHAQHAAGVIACLEAGRHVFVEKPLCVNTEELEQIAAAAKRPPAPVLFVDFNRRFAPLSQRLLESRMRDRQPVDVRYVFRLEPLTAGEWTSLPAHGGRFVGEICHAVDWILWFVGSRVLAQQAIAWRKDEADIFLRFEDSSRAHLQVRSVEQSGEEKETVEVAVKSTRWVVHDFLRLETFERGILAGRDEWKSKGHREALDAFAGAMVRSPQGDDPCGFLESMRRTLDLNEALRAGGA